MTVWAVYYTKKYYNIQGEAKGPDYHFPGDKSLKKREYVTHGFENTSVNRNFFLTNMFSETSMKSNSQSKKSLY